MKKVFQSRTGTNGDCLRASIASILELTLEEVPHFMPSPDNLKESYPQIRDLQAWLNKRGLFLFEMQWQPEGMKWCQGCVDFGTHWLGTVQSQMGEGYSHAVVCRVVETAKNEFTVLIVHDPDGGVKDASAYKLLFLGLLVPVNPARMVVRYRPLETVT